jgi:fructose-bisphosphate aldolase class II/tagatose 1,6-diphosphate aldolase GatY/KbaY
MINQMKLQDKFKELEKKQKGLLATNFYNYETLSGILTAASELYQPIILQLTKSSIEYMGLNIAVSMARTALKDYEVEGWLHLDHGDSYDLVHQCLDAGFDSVMIDASERPFHENISITRNVVKLAAKYGANVEAELGYVAKLGQSQENSGFTQPEEAKKFVDETNVNALAVAIGTAHGFYKTAPTLQMDLLSEIHKATNATLVLHGGSGVPHQVLSETINRGICKINLATEIKNIFMKTLKDQLAHTDEIDLRKVFPVATRAVTDLVKEKLRVVNNI